MKLLCNRSLISSSALACSSRLGFLNDQCSDVNCPLKLDSLQGYSGGTQASEGKGMQLVSSEGDPVMV